MAMVDVDSGSLYRRTHSLWLGLGSAAAWRHERGELSQWLCHDDNAVNTVLELISASLYFSKRGAY